MYGELWNQSLKNPLKSSASIISEKIDKGFRDHFGPFKDDISELEFKTIVHDRIKTRIAQFQVPVAKNCANRNVLIFPGLQIDPLRVICNVGKEPVPELQVDKIIKQRCTVSRGKLDVALMSSCGQLVYSVQETKKVATGISTKSTIKDFEQLAGYMFTALAFSHWGVGQKNGNEIISGLLVYPTAIYRLSIWKPTEEDKIPFGFMHKVEMTTNPLMMGWVLEVCLQKYEADYQRLKGSALNFKNVNPVLWTPINCNLGTPLQDASKTNLGFLFKSNAKILAHLIEHTPKDYLTMHFCVQLNDIAPGEDLIVKYLSALLLVPPKCDNIIQLIKAEITAQELARKDEELARKNEEMERLRAEIAALRSGGRLSSDEGLANSLRGSGRAKVGAPVSGINSGLGIKHPYLGVITYDAKHPVIVMRDMGISVSEEINNNNLQVRWRINQQLRRTFAKDVGESALNLVDSMNLCHNDIRAPNIMISVKGDSFCLIDFDMSSTSVSQPTARVLKHIDPVSSKPALMMFSIAQIALVVFQLDSNSTNVDVSDVRSFWLEENPQGKQWDLAIFEDWVKSKGPLVQAVFSDMPPAVSIVSKTNFLRVIDALVQ